MRQERYEVDSLLYNSRIIATYAKLLKRRYDHVNINDILSYADMEPYQVEDEDQWFTQDQVDRFYEKLVDLTGNRDIAREAGRFSGSSDGYGTLKSYILGFIGPASTCEIIAKTVPSMTRSSLFEATRFGADKIRITVTPKPGVNEKEFQCENRMGYFEALSDLFHQKLLSIEHRECMFKGAAHCTYDMTWQVFRADFWKRLRNLVAPVLAAATLTTLYLSPTSGAAMLCASLLAIFVLSATAWKIQKDELYKAVGSMRTSTDELLGKIVTNHNHVRMIHEIWLVLTTERDTKSLLHQVARILEKRLDYDRGMILLANQDKTMLTLTASFGYSEDLMPLFRGEQFTLRKGSNAVFSRSFFSRQPLLINDLEGIKADLSSHSLQFARALGSKSFLCCPIICSDESIGIIAVDNVETRRPLLQSDIDQLLEISPAIGITIKNAFVTEASERQFSSILEALASSIDARDTLTAGHSERVTRFASGIAQELGLSRDHAEMIRVASLLHDYGKIGIPDSILKKTGRLTQREFEEIKTHATKTRQILEKIDFDGIYKEVPLIASSHHEKFDGSGYPNGLKSDQIPYGARILAVADVFEAVTSKRHYRDPMALKEAFKILDEGKNRHFDPTIVEAFVRYYQNEGRFLDSPAETQQNKTDSHSHSLWFQSEKDGSKSGKYLPTP
jgi:HD-GYP domain-containing protein (c-di-GMP phosphodiesterase class II)